MEEQAEWLELGTASAAVTLVNDSLCVELLLQAKLQRAAGNENTKKGEKKENKTSLKRGQEERKEIYSG